MDEKVVENTEIETKTETKPEAKTELTKNEDIKGEETKETITEDELRKKILDEIAEEQRRNSLTEEEKVKEDNLKIQKEYKEKILELEKREKLIVLKEEFNKNALNTDLLNFIDITKIKNDKTDIQQFVKNFNDELQKVKDEAVKDFKTEYLKDRTINYKETKKATKTIKTAKDAVSQLFK